MDITPAQSRLAQAGLYVGAQDNIMGRGTMSGLMMRAAGLSRPTAVISAIAPALVQVMATAQLTTPLRLLHFLAQATVETASWETLVEYGDEAYFARYDGRADLGNSFPGDGFKFRGRGPLQLTGRANYARFSGQVGADLVGNPDLLLTDMAISAAAAAHYWVNAGCNVAADADDIDRVTRLVNGGENGEPARETCLNRLKAIWGLS
jgi:putative chitinase